MRCWRISRAHYIEKGWLGEGARRHGGRWNNIGISLVYASSTPSLSFLEYLVHINPDLIPDDLRLAFIDVADALLHQPGSKDLVAGWNATPPPPATATLGDSWVRSRSSLGLIVPSALVPHDVNILLNPAHPKFSDLKPSEPIPFPLDPRFIELLGRTQ